MATLALATPNLITRDVGVSDADAFFSYMKRDQYWRHLPIEPPTIESVAAKLEASLRDQVTEPRTGYLMAAVDKHSGSLIGEGILHIRSIRWRQGEIGWGVAADHVGQGLATEIGMAMLQLAFGNLSLHRVFAQCRIANEASRRIMAKLGMREEGILRDNVLARGAWWWSVHCSILATELPDQMFSATGSSTA